MSHNINLCYQGLDDHLVSYEVEDLANGTYLVSYTPDLAGKLKIKIDFGGEPVTHSPFLVDVYPVGNANAVRIVGEYFCYCLVTISK